ncbi:hypothetical protein PoB_006223300 [Plakobranchus ocellatus]|uniref:Uncharacterized protein n=1 Tax=Plakobranchus ocellatus TaxID=259542 RepID=A0AAV4CUZ2_9GAST|nr:hypothetical protein PoB_006223300 [Plakobranchus ocellatus]
MKLYKLSINSRSILPGHNFLINGKKNRSSLKWGVGSTVDSESTLRSAGTLVLQAQAPPPASCPDGGSESLRSPSYGLAIHTQTHAHKQFALKPVLLYEMRNQTITSYVQEEDVQNCGTSSC